MENKKWLPADTRNRLLDLCKSRKNFRDGFFETGDHSAIRDKFRIMDGIDCHSVALL